MAADLTARDNHLAAHCAAIASIGAGAIHLGVVPAHWSDWVPSGLFFAALALFQLAWAFAVWSRPTPWLLAAGIGTNAAAAVLWVLAHTQGAPLGPGSGQVETVNAAGICVLLLQCYVVMGAALSWSRRGEPRKVPGFNRFAILLAANTVMAAAVTAGLVSALAGHQHHHGSASMEAESDHTVGLDVGHADHHG